ncbi:NAD-dependent epimerase/dehydratase family protein [Taibaiella koreensis]|uniref:NAD-dependent epimerase/dehydratase family protein n=1 Tax=Taibaiella koreensis TaxID=1268548 RepID=UPI000E5996C3|nr:NAD-dependent epimerase/dehydratase family protein [Taibaiella koreensis]
MNSVLITGSSGFLGRRLIRKLENEGISYLALNSRNCDLTRDDSLAKAISNPGDFDYIFHLAAWTQAGTFCDTHRGIQWIVNQQINTNMLAWWQQHAPQAKMIALGTSISYTVEEGLSEEKYMQGIPTDKFYAYAMCKRMLLAGLECLQRQYGMQYLYLVPSTLYGPDYHTDGRQLHFIYDLIRKIINGKKHGTPVTLWGDGEQRRELVYVDDFVQVMLALNNKIENEIYNIGSGEDHSIRDFARIICEKTGYDFNQITYDTTQYVGAKSKILAVDKYRSLLGRTLMSTDLSDGIEQTIAWVRSSNLVD